MPGLKPPLWMVVGTQVMSTIGDSFGQRCSRVSHKGSRRHFLISMVAMTCVQMFVFLGIIQLAFPSFTSVIYVKNSAGEFEETQCYKEIDLDGDFGRNCTTGCTPIECPSQGPFSVPRSLRLCPTLWLNDFVDIIYYLGEILLYKEPYGLVLLVVSALTSSLMIKPVGSLFGQKNESVPWPVMLLGVAGCLMCIIEKPPAEKKEELEVHQSGGEEEAAEALAPSGTGADRPQELMDAGVSRDDPEAKWESDAALSKPLLASEPPSNAVVAHSYPKKSSAGTACDAVLRMLAGCRLVIPFSMLAVCYGMWFILQVYYSDKCRCNAWGYNSVDQIMLPLYVYPFILVVDLIKPLKNLIESGSDRDESFWQAIKATWKEASLFDLFMYRGFINTRAMVYSYFSVMYDTNLVYIELTLIRVILSWLGSIVLTLIIPSFIRASPEETSILKNPVNISLKIVGTVFITGSLCILYYVE